MGHPGPSAERAIAGDTFCKFFMDRRLRDAPLASVPDGLDWHAGCLTPLLSRRKARNGAHSGEEMGVPASPNQPLTLRFGERILYTRIHEQASFSLAVPGPSWGPGFLFYYAAKTYVVSYTPFSGAGISWHLDFPGKSSISRRQLPLVPCIFPAPREISYSRNPSYRWLPPRPARSHQCWNKRWNDPCETGCGFGDCGLGASGGSGGGA